MPLRQSADAILISVLEKEIVVEQPTARANHGPAIAARIPCDSRLRRKIPVGLIHPVSQALHVAELIEQRRAARADLVSIRNDIRIDRRTRDDAEIAVGAIRIAHVVHADKNIEVRIELERIGCIEFDTRIRVTARRAIESGVLAEISQAVIDGDRPHRIVQRILGPA